MVVCGAPWEGTGTAEPTVADGGGDLAWPLGSSAFIQRWLQAKLDKLRAFKEKLCCIPEAAPAGRAGMQTAALVHRYCFAAKVTHVLRVLPQQPSRER